VKGEQIMSAQQNKAMVHRLFEEVWNQDKMDVAKEILHDDYSSSENITFATLRGLQVLAADIKFYREMYSNLNFQIKRMFIEADTVVAVWQASGVANNEEFINRKGESENKRLQAEGVSLTRIADGKIIESNFYWPRNPLFP
jgi:ketosteroid isomerase-like protein